MRSRRRFAPPAPMARARPLREASTGCSAATCSTRSRSAWTRHPAAPPSPCGELRARAQPAHTRDHVEDDREVVVGQVEAARGGQQLVDERDARQRHAERASHLEREAEVLLAHVHVEQGFGGHAQHERSAVLDHRRGDDRLQQHLDGALARTCSRTFSSAAGSPPTMNESWPASSVTGLPETGASIRAAPRAATAWPSSRVTAGLTVLISTQTAPGRSPATTPSGPRPIARSATLSVTMLKTASVASATARGDFASVRPAATSARAFSGVRL